MPKITPYSGKDVIKVGKANEPDPKVRNSRWWLENGKELAASVFSIADYLRKRQAYRQHQAALFARLYSNLPIWSFRGASLTKLNPQYRFPNERPTLNVVAMCIDALISRMVQSKPKPMFVTNAGKYKQRRLAKKLNRFIDGEFYRCKVYELGEQVLRDSATLGDGFLKVVETDDMKVGVERKLCTQLFVDESDGMYGLPQQIHELEIMDRDVLAGLFPEKKKAVMDAQSAYFDSSAEYQGSITSQVMVCESWHLPSTHESTDGRHVIALHNDILSDEKDFDEEDFPFIKMPYAPRTLGYFSQGIPERLMGIQNEINRLLYTIQQSLHLCGIPKWMVEDGSKVVSAHINNMIGGIIKYQGVMPELKVAQSVPQELYLQLERLVQYAFNQEGISMLAAASQKPAGLDSGAALREYDDLQSDRFAYLSQRYERWYLDLANKMFIKAKEIAEREGKYSTIYPDKKGLFTIDFPKDELKDTEFVIQAYPVSAFNKHPASRKQEIIELMQAGLIEPSEGRRLLDYPDLQQEEDLLNAPEERILMVLDEIIDEGEYSPPEPDMDLALAKKLVLQYQNKYAQEDLEEEKMDLLRNFSQQIDMMQMSAMPPPVMGAQGMAPGNPAPGPVSPMLPNINQAA